MSVRENDVGPTSLFCFLFLFSSQLLSSHAQASRWRPTAERARLPAPWALRRAGKKRERRRPAPEKGREAAGVTTRT
uniref:Secreted protein n=1 Tax=Oryza sativa subsp. japonica TaxID=39947 RepID=Q6K5L1_ORYSJ|nr:hypothetical protein [Oryza sativa Japonica Group]BAD22114.1 hypothetical protein [Oryza sativa Japonica Group]